MESGHETFDDDSFEDDPVHEAIECVEMLVTAEIDRYLDFINEQRKKKT